MAHTGMFVAPLAGSPPVGMTPTDGRLVMGGIFQVTSQLVAGGGYTASASVMQLTVNQAVFSLTDVTNASAVFFTPTDATTLTFSAAPGSGGRIDLVVVKQNNVENGDADSRVNITVVTGTASGSPVAPAVPAGASKYLAVLINAGVTNIAAATITNYMQTQFADPPLQAPTLAALKTTTGILSQLGVVTADEAAKNGVYLWGGSSWGPVLANDTGWTAVTYTGGWADYGAPLRTVAYRMHNGKVELRGSCKSGNTGVGNPIFTLPAGLRPVTVTEQFIVIANLGTGDLRVDNNGLVYIAAYQNSGSNGIVSLSGITFDPS